MQRGKVFSTKESKISSPF